ncbi:MBOAT family O-acyltransferase [Sphingomonas nostoxanthinifaciens]|uniref:MBOAT family O-acyltransferase n=1 Tax=Sphingomonas nostoxanthinifaciens TaxID=2872652 RepID=UPI001CC1EC5D|nr:MBOAT family O-acyltransferase [Sphingomonas nostoxanthinifaciens]UAK25058.1 hypothetical protein K8P63_02260 [Sphingomonas nostoxanthinifaciens]
MLFTSWPFLLVFLPLAIAGYGVTSLWGRTPAILWLIAASLTFYGFWAPYLIVLISISIAFNYGISVAIRRTADRPGLQKGLLIGGITVDLLALFYYKYAYALLSFFAGYGYLSAFQGMASVVLPLGISFFTFTQIGYLVDCRDGVTKDNSLSDYVLFVTFFPHLIAGPILHNGEMMPQFADRSNYGLRARNIAPALTLFVLGMLKKSLLADTLSPNVAAGFASAASMQLVGGWTTALSYSLQLYFDFSGYSDMAIALAMLFNVRFPPNFNSPYKARNIVDFWQRWHMSLTRYLTQYLYNPIAMAMRRSRIARGRPMTRKALETPGAFAALVAYPTILTMALAGIWHGAGLQFLVFGVLHGLYLTINHGWRMFRPKPPKGAEKREPPLPQIVLSMAITYFAVLLGQVFFRAASCGQAVDLLAAMVGLHGVEHNGAAVEHAGMVKRVLAHLGIFDLFTPARIKQLAQIAVSFAICWFMPNTQQIMAVAEPVLGNLPPPAPRWLQWGPTPRWAVTIAFAALLACLSLGGTSEFLYFQF